MLNHQIHVLRAACEAHGVPVSDRITEADTLVTAADALLADTRSETAPDPYSVTIKDLRRLHAAMVAWPQHAERVTAAETLARVAAGKLNDAWSAFAGYLLGALRAPFDDAVSRYLGGEADALAVVQQLAGTRDVLAATGRRAVVRSAVLEESTRILIVPDYNTALNRVRPRTRELGRLSPEWITEVIALGCAIKWQTPDEQEAADKTLPAKVQVPGVPDLSGTVLIG